MFAFEAQFVKCFLFYTKLQNRLFFVKKNFMRINDEGFFKIFFNLLFLLNILYVYER